MIPPTFRRLTVLRRRYPTVSDHGTDVVNYGGTPTDSPIAGCWAEPIQSTEVNDGRLAVLTGYTLMLPPGVDLRADDHVVVNGKEFGVVGDVLEQPSASGALDHAVARLERWEG